MRIPVVTEMAIHTVKAPLSPYCFSCIVSCCLLAFVMRTLVATGYSVVCVTKSAMMLQTKQISLLHLFSHQSSR